MYPIVRQSLHPIRTLSWFRGCEMMWMDVYLCGSHGKSFVLQFHTLISCRVFAPQLDITIYILYAYYIVYIYVYICVPHTVYIFRYSIYIHTCIQTERQTDRHTICVPYNTHTYRYIYIYTYTYSTYVETWICMAWYLRLAIFFGTFCLFCSYFAVCAPR